MKKILMLMVSALFSFIVCHNARAFDPEDVNEAWKYSKGDHSITLSGADLGSASLAQIQLVGANMSQSNCRNINLYHATLENVNLKGANLKQARFENTTMPNGKKYTGDGGDYKESLLKASTEDTIMK